MTRYLLVLVLLILPGGLGCTSGPASQAARSRNDPNAQPPAVDIAIAETGTVQTPREYTGTTQPIREVSLRSQTQGQLISLVVNVGDPVTQGSVLAQVDDALLKSSVAASRAELASRQSEILQAKSLISEAKTKVEQAKLQLQQAQADAQRLKSLAQDGAIPQQQAEQAETSAKTAAQVLRSAQEQVKNQQQAMAAAEGRLVAQQASVAEVQERRSYAVITSPVTGSVLAKVSEVGNFVQPGTEILKLGDFSQVKVVVQVSDLEVGGLRPGQTVQVKLDALPKREFTGTIARISPAGEALRVPIEVTIPNESGAISSGMLARIKFAPKQRPRVVVPQTALQTERSAREATPPPPVNRAGDRARPTTGTIFVIEGDGETPKVRGRSVRLGEQADGQVEVLSGLKLGERYVSRSSRPLQEGDAVRVSVLSQVEKSRSSSGKSTRPSHP